MEENLKIETQISSEIKVGDTVYCTLPHGTFTVLEVAIVNGNVMYYINNKSTFTWTQRSQLQKIVPENNGKSTQTCGLGNTSPQRSEKRTSFSQEGGTSLP